jgi:hypothetical protein
VCAVGEGCQHQKSPCEFTIIPHVTLGILNACHRRGKAVKRGEIIELIMQEERRREKGRGIVLSVRDTHAPSASFASTAHLSHRPQGRPNLLAMPLIITVARPERRGKEREGERERERERERGGGEGRGE